jgi:Xaa-Pro aminopeptidase
MIRIARVERPQFGTEGPLPPIVIEEYQSRLGMTVDRMTAAGLDFLVVYADREHSANLAYLTGFDPRFEEAVLLLDTRGNRLLLVGNECAGYLPDPSLKYQIELFQDFSLMGQPRGESKPLRAILSGFGIGKGAAVGCVGWKYYGGSLLDRAQAAIEIPSYIVDLLRHLTGDAALVGNATPLLMDVDTGLRVTNSATQIARFEFAAIRTSESVCAALLHLQEGVAEDELERHYHGSGIPQSCHPMVSFGEKVKRGLSSPSQNRAKLGDAFTVAYGLQGALTSRAGAVARGPEDLSEDLRDFYEAYVTNYFGVVAAWYRSVKVGAVAGEVFEAAESARDARLYSFAVNPGHYLHLDEWVHSPFARGSTTVLRSGMALQMDIIPISQGPFCYTNAEDGIVLADETLRADIAQHYPSCWRRMRARRDFMQDVLGIRLDESVLPLSNTEGWLPPFGLAPEKILIDG